MSKNCPLLCVPSYTCTAARVQRRQDTARCRLIGLEAWSTVVVVSPAHPPLFFFRRWVERSGHMVLATPYYIYVSLRLTGCDSGLTKSNGVCQWFSTIGGLGRPRLRLFEPRPVGWGGELPDSGSTIGNEKQRPVPRLSDHASGAPPRRRRE